MEIPLSTHVLTSTPLSNHINDCLLFSKRGHAVLKQAPSDFVVEEVLGWQPSGAGEHLFLWVEKEGSNTPWVARQLAKFYQVPPRDVSYSGLKDRHAITRQFFSIRLPKKPQPLEFPKHDEYRVLEHYWHHKKLKRGFHQANRFVITLREVNYDVDNLAEQVHLIQQHGMPNFFDSQRFGHADSNLTGLLEWKLGEKIPRKRDDISLLLSALRAAAFNHILGERIKQQNWYLPLGGDVMQLDGSGSVFHCENADETILKRLAEFDIHPTACLLGLGESKVSAQTLVLEEAILQDYLPDYTEILSKNRVETARRALRVKVEDFHVLTLADKVLQFSFQLPTGSYASALLKQFFNF